MMPKTAIHINRGNRTVRRHAGERPFPSFYGCFEIIASFQVYGSIEKPFQRIKMRMKVCAAILFSRNKTAVLPLNLLRSVKKRGGILFINRVAGQTVIIDEK